MRQCKKSSLKWEYLIQSVVLRTGEGQLFYRQKICQFFAKACALRTANKKGLRRN